MKTLKEILELTEELSGAELTNRCIPGDDGFSNPEWLETGVYLGVPVMIYYRTTPDDQEMANETGDYGCIDFSDRIDGIYIDSFEFGETEETKNMDSMFAEEITGLELFCS